jgi:protein CpxP
METMGATFRKAVGILALLAVIPASGWAFGGRGGDRGTGPGRHFARMARDLDLTADQKAQIKTILDAEREKSAPLRKQLADNREQLRKLAEKDPFDEAAVRKLAADQEKSHIEMVVSRTRTMNRVHALLTPEQQEKARKLRPFREGGPSGGGRRGYPKGM